MQTYKLLFSLLFVVFSGLNAHAQLDGILQKAKKVIEKKTDNISTDFMRGDSLIFAEDFFKNQTATFKTNGAASVTTVEGQPGKWMLINDKAIYKLSKQIFYPKHFTVEFDILETADQVKDVAPMSFGFATDNSVREYASNIGAYVQVHYYDANQVNVGNNNLNKFVNTTFDLAAGLNRPLHVSLIIEGERMVVYLNKTKLADTDLFRPSDAKNFYISAPWQYENGSRLLISNVRITGFKR